MRLFLLYLSKILIYSYIFGFIFQFMADEGLRKMKNSGFAEWDQILEGKVNADLIIKGSSRAVVGYNPDVIEKITGLKSYNLGFDAGSYNIQEIKSNLYNNNNSTPQVIIQNVDLTHFSKTKQIPNKYEFLPFYLSSDLRNQFQSVEADFMEYYYLPLINYNGRNILFYKGLCSFFGLDLSDFNSNKGFHGIKRNFKKDINNLKYLANVNKSSGIENWSAGLASLEKDIFSNDTPVLILVWAPEYKDRLGVASHISSNIKNQIRELASLSKKVFFIDLSHHSISQNQSMFYDTFHLNKKGAEVFSTVLASEVNKILQER